MLILAVVACVAVLALAVTKSKAPPHRAAPQVDERVGEKDRAVHDSADSQLMRLELAIDTIAVEVERIGENQRFLTKLLADEQPESARSEQDRREV